MKKILIFSVLSMCTVLASAKTFLDKTNLEQLSFRTLDAGQVAWNEEDGSAVVYIGSPSETKNIRVTDPTALKGFRYKQIDDELTYNCHPLFVKQTDGFKWTANSTADAAYYQYEYIDVPKTGGDKVYDASVGTVGSAAHWESGMYIKNADGTYSEASIADGTIVGGTNSNPNVQYAYKHKYLDLTIDVIAKDTNIEELDFFYEQSSSSGLGDMDPIGVDRTIVYNGRRATIHFKVNYVSSNGKYMEANNFTARCLGVGDIVQANDLSVNKIYIIDSLSNTSPSKSPGSSDDDEYDPLRGAFDLFGLREWCKNLNKDNLGKHWANYVATNHVIMNNKCIVLGSGDSETTIGQAGDNELFFSTDGMAWLTYESGSDAAVPEQYQGVQIAFTAINQNRDTDCWELDVLLDVPDGKQNPPTSVMDVLWTGGLERPCLWQPITCQWQPTDEFGTSYKIIVPQVYSTYGRGFWKIRVNVNPLASKLRIKAQLELVGSDGRMYKLEWPEGGGTVTATLVD